MTDEDKTALKDVMGEVVHEGFEDIKPEIEETAKTAAAEAAKELAEKSGKEQAEMLEGMKEEYEASQKATQARLDRLMEVANKDHTKDGYFWANDKYVPLTALFRAAAARVPRFDNLECSPLWTPDEFHNHQKELKQLNEGTNTAGGYLVPEETNAMLLEACIAEDMMTSKVSRIKTSVQVVNINYESTAPSGGWVAEEGSKKDKTTDPVFGQKEITVYKYAAMIPVSEELLSDANTNVGAYLAQRMVREFAYARQRYVIAGTGTAQPSGIIQCRDGIIAANHVHYYTAGALAFTDLTEGLFNYLQKCYRANATWGMSDQTWLDVMNFVDGQNRPLFLRNLQDGPPWKLLGKGVVEDNYWDIAGMVDRDIYVGDFSRYIMLENGSLEFKVSDEYYFDTDQVAFRWRDRWGGAWVNCAEGIALITTANAS